MPKCVVCGKEHNRIIMQKRGRPFSKYCSNICYTKVWKEKNKEHVKQWKEKNKEHLKQYNKQHHKEYYKKNKEYVKQRNKQLREKYKQFWQNRDPYDPEAWKQLGLEPDKQCPCCERWIPRWMWYKTSINRDGLNAYCPICRCEYKIWYRDPHNALTRKIKQLGKEKAFEWAVQKGLVRTP